MNYTDFKWNKPIFHQAAKYKCIECFYSCEVYSFFEWAVGLDVDCYLCGAGQTTSFCFQEYLYRWDPLYTDTGNKLSCWLADLPEEKSGCSKCPHVVAVGGKYHWTEYELDCRECDGGCMQFDQFIEGTKMKEFIEIAKEESKLIAPGISYTVIVDGVEQRVSGAHYTYIDEFAEGDQIAKSSSWEFKFSAT